MFYEGSLFVGDISRSLHEEQLRQAFENYGSVVSVEIKRDRLTKYSLGYAFVQMEVTILKSPSASSPADS